MAKQKGPIRIQGTLDDLTFYHTEDGDLIRMKSSLTKEKVLADPAFENSRRASSEFGRASGAGALLRKAFGEVAKRAQDHGTHHRLNKAMRAVIESDTVHGRGDKQLLDGNVQMLKGFEWNKHYSFDHSFNAIYLPTIDTASPKMRVEMAAFMPSKALKSPEGSTHFKLRVTGASLNMSNGKYSRVEEETGLLMTKKGNVAARIFELEVPGEYELFTLGIGLEFYKQAGDTNTEMKEGRCFVLAEIARLNHH